VRRAEAAHHGVQPFFGRCRVVVPDLVPLRDRDLAHRGDRALSAVGPEHDGHFLRSCRLRRRQQLSQLGDRGHRRLLVESRRLCIDESSAERKQHERLSRLEDSRVAAVVGRIRLIERSDVAQRRARSSDKPWSSTRARKKAYVGSGSCNSCETRKGAPSGSVIASLSRTGSTHKPAAPHDLRGSQATVCCKVRHVPAGRSRVVKCATRPASRRRGTSDSLLQGTAAANRGDRVIEAPARIRRHTAFR
jgi:hypothetical protein